MEKRKIVEKIFLITLLCLTLTLGFLIIPACGEEDPDVRYTVTWKNYDGTTLEVDENLERGVMPEFNGQDPTKPETDTETFEFIGWDKEIVPVTGNVTYTAKFNAKAKKPLDNIGEWDYVG